MAPPLTEQVDYSAIIGRVTATVVAAVVRRVRILARGAGALAAVIAGRIRLLFGKWNSKNRAKAQN